MKRYFHRLLTICCVLWLCGVPVQAQSLRAYEKAADDAYREQDYYNAATYYEIVLQSKKKSDIYYKYAESLRETYSYAKAAKAYEEVMKDRELRAELPLLEFQYAVCLKHLARYDDAYAAFNRFLAGYKTQDYYRQKATQELQSCSTAKLLSQSPNDSILVVQLSDKINTQYSDFSPQEKHGKFYFSSLRFKADPPKSKKDVQPRGRLVAKALVSPAYNSTSDAQLIDALNSDEEHSANISWSPDGKNVFFTRCTGLKTDSIQCEIWLADYNEADGSFANLRRLPQQINQAGSNNTHPHLAYIEESRQMLLFFSSNRAGGQGKLDIWAAEWKEGDKWGTPFNLGRTINSIEDEMTPFFHPTSQHLYFSSYWHHGLGGLDVFRAKRIGNTVWQTPENLGLPYNSAANDYYFIISKGDSTGFLASNRTGSMVLAGESCCNDIYQFGYKSALTSLTSTTPSVVDTPVVVVKIDTPKVDTPRTDIVKIDTPKVDTPKVDTPRTDVVRVDTPKVDTPKVDTPRTDVVKADPTPTPDLNIKISELNKMLPLTLYFHNDEPDSNTTKNTTDRPYEYAYRDYIGLQTLYKEQHAEQFAAETRPLVLKRIDDFFELEVKGEYNRMNYFFEKVLEVLQAGASLDITIRGYTSPRSNEGYNKALARRRVMSVRKQFFAYKNGIFLTYFQQGKLSVSEDPIGEAQAPSGISDAIDDPQNSIFSVEASRERRAEIIVVQRGAK